MSLSLFIVDLERWALILHLLISLDPTDGFMCRNLQVKALTESHHFDGLFAGFGHLEAPHEHFGVSWGPGRTFQGTRCSQPLLGDFLMVAVAYISVFACVGWWRSSGGRETT